MAKVLMAAGIEEISGAASKINTKSSHRFDQNMLLFTHRKAATASLSCQRAYFRKINSLPWQNGSNDAVSTETLAVRTMFTTKLAAIKARKMNLAVLDGDQQLFLALRDGAKARGYNPTMNVFYWCAAGKYWDNETKEVDFPTGAMSITQQEFNDACYYASKRSI